MIFISNFPLILHFLIICRCYFRENSKTNYLISLKLYTKNKTHYVYETINVAHFFRSVVVINKYFAISFNFLLGQIRSIRRLCAIIQLAIANWEEKNKIDGQIVMDMF